jgi:hypothetical protein
MTKKKPRSEWKPMGRPSTGLERQIGVRVTPELRAALEAEAAERGIEPSVLIREILEKHAKRRKKL